MLTAIYFIVHKITLCICIRYNLCLILFLLSISVSQSKLTIIAKWLNNGSKYHFKSVLYSENSIIPDPAKIVAMYIDCIKLC